MATKIKSTGIDTLAGDISLADNAKIKHGSSNDLQIYHDGSHSYIKDDGTGNLYLGGSAAISFNSSDFGETYAIMNDDGAVVLYHNNVAKLSTDAQGINVTGGIDVADITATGNVTLNSDSGTAYFGAGADLRIFHDGNNSFINNTTGTAGALSLKSHDINLMCSQSHNMAVFTEDGAVTLYYDNAAKLATTNTGVSITGTIVGATATASGGTSTTALASTAFVQQELTTLIGGAPSTLNDLNELAAAINDDANYNSTLTTALATKLPLAGGTMTGNISHASNFTIDAGGNIALDADSGNIVLLDGGAQYGLLTASGGNLIIKSGATTAITFANAVASFASTVNIGGKFNLQDLGNTTVAALQLGNAGIGISSPSTDQMNFITADVTRMVIDSSGKVGIGTAAPDALLEVRGNAAKARFTRSGSAGTNVEFYYGATQAGGIQVQSTGLGISGAARENDLFIKSDGKVGIGTTSPSSLLHLSASSYPKITLNDETGVDRAFSLGTSNETFVIRNETASSDAISIDQNNKVGIGETSPLGKLHVKSSDSGATADASADELVVENNSNTGISILSGTSSTGSIYFGDSGTNWDGYIAYTHGSGATHRKFVIGTAAGGNSLSIDAIGHVGIAKQTPIAWGSGYKSLQIGARGYVGAHSGSDLYVGQNAYHNSGWKYEASVAASLTQHSGGQITHYVTPAGTAGNAITWNIGMHIKPTGEVGIGTTSPAAALEVVRGSAGYAGIFGAPQGSGKVILFKDNHASPNKYNWLVGSQYNTNNAFEITPSTVVGGYTFNAPAITVLETGNVGIGTNAPKRPLQIGATNQFPISFNGNYPDIHFNTYYESGWRIHSAGFGAKTTFNGVTGAWVFSNVASSQSAAATFTPLDRFAILANGNVGIGTASPSSALHVHENDSAKGNTQLHIHNDKTDDAGVLRIEGKRTSENDTAQILFANNGNLVSSIKAYSGGDGGHLRFYTSKSGSGSSTMDERLRLHDTGLLEFKGSDNTEGIKFGSNQRIYGGTIRAFEPAMTSDGTVSIGEGLDADDGTVSIFGVVNIREQLTSPGGGVDAGEFISYMQGTGWTDILNIHFSNASWGSITINVQFPGNSSGSDSVFQQVTAYGHAALTGANVSYSDISGEGTGYFNWVDFSGGIKLQLKTQYSTDDAAVRISYTMNHRSSQNLWVERLA
jgi:hypothetical protein